MPDQHWSQDGTADATPQPPCPINETKKLPLEHRPKGSITILRSEYPDGLVVLPMEGYPVGGSATLPLRTSSGSEIFVGEQDWPDGMVGWFTES